MYSITWCSNPQGRRTVIGDTSSILNVYSLLLLSQHVTSIHCYDMTTGIEYDPETGLIEMVD